MLGWFAPPYNYWYFGWKYTDLLELLAASFCHSISAVLIMFDDHILDTMC